MFITCGTFNNNLDDHCGEPFLFCLDSGSFTQSGVYKILASSSMRKAVLVGCMLQAIQQLSGINTVM